MFRRTGLILLGALLVGVPTASAQRVEASFKGGYTASEGVTAPYTGLVGYNEVAPASGGAFHFTFGVFVNENVELEFLWSKQSSELVANGPAGRTPWSELSVQNYMGNFVYNWGTADSKVRPYFFGGLGAASYGFGNLLIQRPPAVTADQIEDRTRFSTNWGGGVKFYFSKNVGAVVGLRWIPTYIKSDPAGVWCDPWYGCWQMVNNQYSHAFETAAGLTFRF